MKKTHLLLLGLVITLAIFTLATVAGRLTTPGSTFFPNSFITHSVMLILTVVALAVLKKHVPFRLAWPRFKTVWKPALFGFLTTVVVNILLAMIGLVAGSKIEAHPLLTTFTPLQTFLFIFIYASLAEELLLRGFLQNILRPFNDCGVRLFGRFVSFPVILSSIVFGLFHLILLTSGADNLLVVRTVIFTTVLGLFAGYYQQKYDNHSYALIVHMAGNLVGVVVSFIQM